MFLACAPPPGAYNPKFDNHVMGAIMYTKDNKPIHPESPATSISDSKSVQSSTSGRNFRTVSKLSKNVNKYINRFESSQQYLAENAHHYQVQQTRKHQI